MYSATVDVPIPNSHELISSNAMNTSAESLWYYTDGSTTFGPFTASVIRQLIDAGVIGQGFHLRREEDDAWSPLTEVKLHESPQCHAPLVPPPLQAGPKFPNPFVRYYIGAIKKYSVLTGRSGRSEYWLFHLFSLMILNSLALLQGENVANGVVVFTYMKALLIPPIFLVAWTGALFFAGSTAISVQLCLSDNLLIFPYALAVLLPTFTVGVRRLQDAGFSGWLFFCPFFGVLAALVKGAPGPNRYGEPPRL